MRRTLVVVGFGMVGHRLVRQLDLAGWRVVVLGEERRPAYNRVRLSSYLSGAAPDELELPALPDEVEIRTGIEVSEVDVAGRVITAGGEKIRYDALVLATGSRPFVPPVPGRDGPNCFTYRTFDDLDALRAAARPGRLAVVVGGGLLGLEAADALRRLGMRPHVVELAPHLMPAQLDPGAAAVLHRYVEDLGVAVHCGAGTARIDEDAVVLSEGTVLPAELVVFAAGVRPRADLAPELERGPRGGYLVDGLGRTSAAGVWAAGDCAAVDGHAAGLLAPGHLVADRIAAQLGGETVAADQKNADVTVLKLLGLTVAAFGVRPDGAVDAVLTRPPTHYAKLHLEPDTGVLLGGVLAGTSAPATTITALLGRRPPPGVDHLLLT